MGKISASYLIIIFVVLSYIILLFGPNTNSEALEIYFGDLVVNFNETVIYEETNLRVDGNIIVKDGGVLIFHNCTVSLGGYFDGQHRVSIESGGLIVIDNSTFRPFNDVRFKFSVSGGIDARNSEFHQLWGYVHYGQIDGGIEIKSASRPAVLYGCNIWETISNGIYLNDTSFDIKDCRITNIEKRGIYVGNSNGLIEGCIIKDCYNGIYISDSDVTIKNCEISIETEMEYYGSGIYEQRSEVHIENNEFYGKLKFGIKCVKNKVTIKDNYFHDLEDCVGIDDFETEPCSIINNTFVNVKQGINWVSDGTSINGNSFTECVQGLYVAGIPPSALENNIFDSCTDYDIFIHVGIYMINNKQVDNRIGILKIESSSPILENLDIAQLNCKFDSLPTLINCTIEEIYGRGNCIINLKNTDYNETNVDLTYSCDLYVNWFLSVLVQDENSDPVMSAKVSIQNFIENKEITTITDSNGITGEIILPAYALLYSRWHEEFEIRNYDYLMSVEKDEIKKTYYLEKLEGTSTINIILSPSWEGPNKPPLINKSIEYDLKIYEGETIEFTVDVFDPDTFVIQYSWFFNENLIIVDTNNSYEFHANYTSSGTHTIMVEVFDGYNYDNFTWTLEITNVYNRPDDDISPTFNDQDNDSLPDQWEYIHFRDYDEDGEGDYDKDGLSNIGEYERGSDPTDPEDPFTNAAKQDDLRITLVIVLISFGTLLVFSIILILLMTMPLKQINVDKGNEQEIDIEEILNSFN